MDETTRRRAFFCIAAAYFLSTWLAIPSPEIDVAGLHRIGRFGWMPPSALSGDSPHYLVAVRSLIDDFDFDVSNNYEQAERGGLDAGVRFRGAVPDRHADRDGTGREIPTHSPFFIALLAVFALPARGTVWVEAICVWVCLAAGLVSLWWIAVHASRRRWLLLAAFATPLWAYSRDIWVEPFIAAAWAFMLTSRRLWLLFLLGFVGICLKYPFAVVPAAMAAVAWRNGEKRRAAVLGASVLCGLAAVVAVVQILFRDVGHFSLFHSGIHGDFDWPFDGVVGLLLDPENGLLFFCPMLAFAFLPLWRKRDWLLPAAAFFLVHAAYSDWRGGTGFSARYLVPLIPFCMAALDEASPRLGFPFKIACLYSLAWGILAGLAPALVYDRTPWGVVAHIVAKLTG